MQPRRRNVNSAEPAARARVAPCLRVGLVACAIALLAGCRGNGKYDGIEAELRTRNRELAETQHALDQARQLNRAYEQTRGTFPGAVPAPPYYPASNSECGIREITLGRGTGGVDDDATPGDEHLMAVIVPTDDDKSPTKVQARATIAAWESGPDGVKRLIGTWELTPEQLRSTWKSGLIATGYFVPLQWQQCPTQSKLRVAVRLTTLDGKQFEADRDITVRPQMQAIPPVRVPAAPPPPIIGVPPPLTPNGVEELPPPAGLDPKR